MNKILVDGYNVIHRVPELRRHLETSLERAREELISVLRSYLLTKKVKLTVVFDGADDTGLPSRQKFGSLAVIFSRKPLKADPVIISLIAREKHKKGLGVVSDDSEIKQTAKSHGVSIISSHEFYARVTKRLRSNSCSKTNDRELSAEELAEWLELFGER